MPRMYWVADWEGTGNATLRQLVWRVWAVAEEKEDHLYNTSNASTFVECKSKLFP